MSGRLIDQAGGWTVRSFVGDVVRVSSRISGNPPARDVSVPRRNLLPPNPIASMLTAIPLRVDGTRETTTVPVDRRITDIVVTSGKLTQRDATDPISADTGIPLNYRYSCAGQIVLITCYWERADIRAVSTVRGETACEKRSFMRFRHTGCPRFFLFFPFPYPRTFLFFFFFVKSNETFSLQK